MEHSFAALPSFLAPHTRILLVCRAKDSLDALATTTVIHEWLQDQKKTVECLTPGLSAWPVPLQTTAELQTEIGPFRSLEVRIPLKNASLNELSYAIENDSLRLSLTPKSGMWNEDDVRAQSGQPRFDTCIVIGPATKQELSELVPGDAEWMQALPTLHITLQTPTNPWSPQTISLGAKTGLSEHLASWLLANEPETLTKSRAHTLLAGILSSSNSFRSSLVTSDTFETASELVRRGADRQAIIHALWRTIPVRDLNLWGRAMMRLTPHATLPLITTLISAHDFLQTKSSHAAIPALAQYLLDRVETAKILLIFATNETQTRVHVITRAPLSAELIARWFDGQGNTQQAEWNMQTSDLLEAQQQVLTRLEEELPRLLIHVNG